MTTTTTTTTKGTERGTTTIDHVKTLQEVDDETTAELYANDPGFRLSYGPSIALYGDSGMDYCLIGLEFMFDYADFGVCYGVVTGESSSLGNNNCPLLAVAFSSTTSGSTGSSSSTSSKKNEEYYGRSRGKRCGEVLHYGDWSFHLLVDRL